MQVGEEVQGGEEQWIWHEGRWRGFGWGMTLLGIRYVKKREV